MKSTDANSYASGCGEEAVEAVEAAVEVETVEVVVEAAVEAAVEAVVEAAAVAYLHPRHRSLEPHELRMAVAHPQRVVPAAAPELRLPRRRDAARRVRPVGRQVGVHRVGAERPHPSQLEPVVRLAVDAARRHLAVGKHLERQLERGAARGGV